MSDDEIKTIVESAFKPFSCATLFDDYGEKLKLKVRNNGNEILPIECPTDLVRDENGLKSFLEACRQEIEKKGFCLDPWHFAVHWQAQRPQRCSQDAVSLRTAGYGFHHRRDCWAIYDRRQDVRKVLGRPFSSTEISAWLASK